MSDTTCFESVSYISGISFGSDIVLDPAGELDGAECDVEYTLRYNAADRTYTLKFKRLDDDE